MHPIECCLLQAVVRVTIGDVCLRVMWTPLRTTVNWDEVSGDGEAFQGNRAKSSRSRIGPSVHP